MGTNLELVIMSLGSTPAGDGIAGVVGSALTIFATLGLIYAVLVVLDRYNKKRGGGEKPPEEHDESAGQRAFPEVLDEEIHKNENKDGKA